MVTWITPSTSTVGSAWLGSPLLCMQVAHWSSSFVGLPVGCVVAVVAALPLLAPPVLWLVPKLATCGGFVEPPPHAASPMATAATRPASSPQRQEGCISLVFLKRLSTVTSSPFISYLSWWRSVGSSCMKQEVTPRSHV
jgi:hypothetical protein